VRQSADSGQVRSRRCDLILWAPQRASGIGIPAYNNLRARIGEFYRARQFARARSIGSSGRIQGHSRAGARYVSSLTFAYPRSLAETEDGGWSWGLRSEHEAVKFAECRSEARTYVRQRVEFTRRKSAQRMERTDGRASEDAGNEYLWIFRSTSCTYRKSETMLENDAYRGASRISSLFSRHARLPVKIAGSNSSANAPLRMIFLPFFLLLLFFYSVRTAYF